MWKLILFSLGIPSPKASDFDRNLDLKIREEQQTTSGQQTVGGRRLLLTSDFQIEISFKFEFLIEMLPKNNYRRLAQLFRLPSLADFLWFENRNLFCAWFVYMHPTLSEWLSTLELYSFDFRLLFSAEFSNA